MKKLFLFFAIIMFASCSPDDNSKKGVEIVSYELTKTKRNPSGYFYIFDIIVKNHSNKAKSGIVNISLDMGNNVQGFNHISVTLEPNETKAISNSDAWFPHKNGVVTNIKFNETD